MYIKLLGALAAIGACLMAGFSFYSGKKQEYSALVSCRLMLQFIRSELHSCPAELNSVLENIQDRLDSAARDFVLALSKSMDRLGEASFSALWDECIDSQLTALSHEEKKPLRDLGGVIGRYDTAQQISSIDSTIARMMQMEADRSKRLEADRKLSLGLPGALGLMLVIVLI